MLLSEKYGNPFFLKNKLVLLFLKEYCTEKEVSQMEDASKGAYPSNYEREK